MDAGCFYGVHDATTNDDAADADDDATAAAANVLATSTTTTNAFCDTGTTSSLVSHE